MFCTKCGAILLPKKEKGKNVLACACGYTDKETKAEFKEVAEEEKELEVIHEGEDESLPVTDVDGCSKCGNKKARFWMQQTRAGDEPETRFFKCTECKHIWREY